jgi:hypothetical protein
MLAESSGTCPLCARYIREGRSQIEALDFSIVPLTVWAFDAKRGVNYRHHTNYIAGRFEHNGTPRWFPGRAHPRKWVHAACKRKLDRRLAKGETLVEIIGDYDN